MTSSWAKGKSFWARKSNAVGVFRQQPVFHPASPLGYFFFHSYKNLRPQRYVPVGHPKLAATGGRGKPSILLWKRKDPRSDGITDVNLSYNEEDEVR